MERAESLPVTGERRLYRFDEFQVDPVRRRLLRDGEPVAVTSKAFSLLVVLLERHGQVVEKEELFRRVWPDTYVTEANLTQNVSSLRKALGDRASSDRRFIVTVPGQGYSFVGDVIEIASEASGAFPAVRLEELRPSRPPADLRAAAGPAEVSVPAGEAAPVPEEVESEAALPMTPPPAIPATLWRWDRRAGLAAAGVAGVLALGLLLFLVIARFGKPVPGAGQPQATAAAAASQRPSLAVLGFKDLGASSSSESSWLGLALSEMLTTELSAGRQARLISGENVARARQSLSLPYTTHLRHPDLVRLRAILGADRIVLGSYLVLDGERGRQIRLDVQVVEVPDGSPVTSLTETGKESDLFEIVARTGTRLRQKLGLERLSPVQVQAVQALHPQVPEAARLTAKGLARLRAYDPMQARELLEQAVEIEPGSATIHSLLARTWNDLGNDARSLAEARRALDLSSSLPREDRLAIEARFYAAGRQWTQAAEVYRSLWTFFPDDVDHGLQLAISLINAGRSTEALEILAILRHQPAGQDDPRIDLEEARAAARVADFATQAQAAGSAAAKARRSGERLALARALIFQGDTMLSTGKPEAAAAQFREAEKLARAVGHPWTAGMALANLGVALRTLGDLDEAELRHQQALDVARQLGSAQGIASQLYNLAMLDQDRGELAKALRLYEEGRIVYVEVGDRMMQGRALAGMAWIRLRQGEAEAARRDAEAAVTAAREVGNRADEARAREILASILSWQGEIAAAHRQLESSLHLLVGSKQPALAAMVLASSADVLARLGDLELAGRRLNQAAAVERRSGDRMASGLLLGTQSRLALRVGDVDGARKLGEALLRQSRQMGTRIDEAWALHELGRVQRAAGDLPAARASFQGSLRRSGEAGDALQSAVTRLELARLELAGGKPGEAVELARAVAAWAAPRTLAVLEAQAYAVMAEALLGEGRTAESVVAAGRVRDLVRATQDRELALLAAVPLARAETAAGDPEGGMHDLRTAIAEAEQIGLLTIARDARLALGEIEARQAQGDQSARKL